MLSSSAYLSHLPDGVTQPASCGIWTPVNHMFLRPELLHMSLHSVIGQGVPGGAHVDRIPHILSQFINKLRYFPSLVVLQLRPPPPRPIQPQCKLGDRPWITCRWHRFGLPACEFTCALVCGSGSTLDILVHLKRAAAGQSSLKTWWV